MLVALKPIHVYMQYVRSSTSFTADATSGRVDLTSLAEPELPSRNSELIGVCVSHQISEIFS